MRLVGMACCRLGIATLWFSHEGTALPLAWPAVYAALAHLHKGCNDLWEGTHRPAGLRDHDHLAIRDRFDLVDPVAHPRAGVPRLGVRIEEWVAVEGAVVRGGAQHRVGDHLAHRVHGDDGPGVAGRAQLPAHGADGARDLGRRGAALVDGLVADVDRVHQVPAAGDLSDQRRGLLVRARHVVDAGEELHPRELRDRAQRRGHLVAVGAVHADEVVGRGGHEARDVRIHFARGAAPAVLVVGRVRDALAEAAAGVDRRWLGWWRRRERVVDRGVRGCRRHRGGGGRSVDERK